MNKRIILTLLLGTFLTISMPVGIFANQNKDIVNKNTTENLKIYRKTSLSPGQDNKRFNIPIHSNEPLGIEVLEETEIEILIEGKGISGSGSLNLHDVNNLRGIKNIKVGEKTTVKIPRKGQLFLDVGHVKYNSQDQEEDFSFNVKITLDDKDYEITPIFDVREEKLSDKVILDEEEFEKAILSKENENNSAVLISENVRIHIPLSKHIPKYIDASDTLDAHESLIAKYNKLAGLDEKNDKEINRPREGFFLIGARNEQGGYMSAGGTMLDTLPKNVHEYLKRPKVDDIWGMYHEYGHMYEQGWGFGEYWNNVFANMKRRDDFDNQEWSWLYGKDKKGYEDKNILPSYKKYLETGASSDIHSMYFFLSFIDNIDSEFTARIETVYRENDIRYGGWDYVAYFIAKEYNLNVIPYIEAAGQKVNNKEIIDMIIDNTESTYMYMPENDSFNEVKNISLPPTLKKIYSGKNRVISGMSNKDAQIEVDIDGKIYKSKADNNGKFSIELENNVNVDSNITVKSIEAGKKPSFAKKVEIIDEYAKISFRGYESKEFLSLKLDNKAKKFNAKSANIAANPYYNSSEYIKIEQYNKKGQLKNKFSLDAKSNANALADKLNETSYIEGDYLKLSHKEQYGRLAIEGDILNAPQILENGVGNLDLANSYFYIIDGNLIYSDEKLDLAANADDLKELIKKCNFKEEKYTKTSFKNYKDTLDFAKSIVNDENTSKETIAITYEALEKAIDNLREINKVEFKGYNNKVFLELKFDTDLNKFIASTNNEIANAYQGSQVYAQIKHFDKKGNVKETYSIKANETGKAVADKLNNLSYSHGDYLKFNHIEKDNRLVVNGYVENAPYDLSTGSSKLDLENSLFYLGEESLQYSPKQLDLSANKDDLIYQIQIAKEIQGDKYTKTSFGNLQLAIENGEKLVNTQNVTEEEVQNAIDNILYSIENLKEINTIQFKGYENKVFLKLGFDTEAKKFKAVSNGKMVHAYQGSKVYAKVEHFGKKGNLKGEYSVKANETADKVANDLNKASYSQGDYLKLSHLEQNSRLVINGYIENSPKDFSTGSAGVDLSKSLFYLNGEYLTYSDDQLDLSADKKILIEKIDELKLIKSTNYTKTSFANLQKEIEKAEELVKGTNILEEEISSQIEDLEKAKADLKVLNEVVFKGYNNNEFLKLSFDSENKELKAVSNGQVANKYISGKYAQITHFGKKGNVKETYTMKGSQTADDLANKLNNLKYTDGDYLKLFHAEPTSRLAVKGYVEDAPFNLSNGVKDLDLNSSLFYLNGESFKYSSEQLDLSSDKKELVAKIEEAKKISKDGYTKTTYENLSQVIAKSEELVNETNVLEEEIAAQLESIEKAINDLRKLNKIEFKGYENTVFMTLEFDDESNKFKAVSNGKTVHPYQSSNVYSKVEHFGKKGNLKGEYSVKANETADKMANELNNLSYADGDYIKLSHLEKNSRLVINGYVENSPYDLSTGAKDLDLDKSHFYLGGESLRYSGEQLDLSADKKILIEKIAEAKNISSENYTKSSFENLSTAISEGENLVNTTNTSEEEINLALENLKKAIENLREINIVEFKGYDNVVFLTLGFDKTNNKFNAVSNGQMVHAYQGSNVYAKVQHFDKDNNLKGEYSVKANEDANNMAYALNEASISQGDYIKFYHLEQRSRLAIKGYINNLDMNLSNGVGDLKLGNSIFNLDDENLTYIN